MNPLFKAILDAHTKLPRNEKTIREVNESMAELSGLPIPYMEIPNDPLSWWHFPALHDDCPHHVTHTTLTAVTCMQCGDVVLTLDEVRP